LQYRCGAKAANELDAFVTERPVGCIPVSLDQYGRTVATCSVGGVDLGEWLVRSIHEGDMMRSNAMPSTPGGARGATSSRGYSASASGKAGSRVNVRLTQMLILEK